MTYRITAPSRIDTTIKLPASKSISNRALIINALAGAGEAPANISDCDDTEVIVRALRDSPYEIDIKAAGTAMRFMTAYLAATPGEHLITGTERMRHRPVKELVDALRYLGADIEYAGEEGFPPLKIRGKALAGGKIEMPGDVSSQYVSALLMIAPVMRATSYRAHTSTSPYTPCTTTARKLSGPTLTPSSPSRKATAGATS